MAKLSNWRSERTLKEYHIDKGWSAEEIADAADVPPNLVTSYLANRGLLRTPETEGASKDRDVGPRKHTCSECGETLDSIEEWSQHHQEEHFLYDEYKTIR